MSAINRFDSMLTNIVNVMKAPHSSLGRTADIRNLHEAARAAEYAWPASKPLVPPAAGRQNLTLQQLNQLASGPNT